MFMQNQTAFDPAEMIDLEAALFPGMLSRSGIVEGTRVEAADGWRPVESLMRGYAVFTFDGGLRQVLAIHREDIRPARLLHVPGGALDNCAEMLMLPGQYMLVQDSRAEDLFGSPLAVVPAAALAGFNGIEWVNGRAKTREIVTLEFEDEEVVYGNTGALFHCPSQTQFGAARLVSAFFNVLDLAQARTLIAQMGRGTNNVVAFAA